MTHKISFCPKSKCKSCPHYGKTQILIISLLEKCSYLGFFWSFISRIQTEYGEMLRISPYSVRMQENTDQKNSEYGHFSCIVSVLKILNFENIFETEVIVLFSKVVLCYNFRSVCLHYDDKGHPKPSLLNFHILHTKKTKFYKINCMFDLWLMTLKIDHF